MHESVFVRFADGKCQNHADTAQGCHQQEGRVVAACEVVTQSERHCAECGADDDEYRSGTADGTKVQTAEVLDPYDVQRDHLHIGEKSIDKDECGCPDHGTDKSETDEVEHHDQERDGDDVSGTVTVDDGACDQRHDQTG